MLCELIPEGVDMIVTALCLDYERRADAIRQRSVGRKTEMQYRYFNYRLHRAAYEIAGEDDALLYIAEIGSHTGYANTELTNVSETTYKKTKSEVKRNIARALCLID